VYVQYVQTERLLRLEHDQGLRKGWKT